MRLLGIGCLLFFFGSSVFADKVITKDGKTYTGKILSESDKAVLIGNPPYDPNSTLIKTEDIETIVYEQYHPNSPSERRRGFTADLSLQGNAYSSSELSLQPSAGLMLGGGFRFHPLIEIGGAFQWVPAVSARDELNVNNARSYEKFWAYSLLVTGKIYPFYYKKKWKTEPYLLTGYGWNHLLPKGTDDSFSGAGWLLGAGAIRPITEHLFFDGHFSYQDVSLDTVDFLGQAGSISPAIVEHTYTLSVGISYRI